MLSAAGLVVAAEDEDEDAPLTTAAMDGFVLLLLLVAVGATAAFVADAAVGAVTFATVVSLAVLA